MYDYDRRSKTAATMDLYGEWRDIVQYNETKESRDFQALLRKAVPYLKSVGYDLLIDDRRTFLSKEHHGSDGWRIAGQIIIKEREENNVQASDPRRVVGWVDSAIGVYGSASKLSEGPEKDRSGQPLTTWLVDLTQS
jgi:hypothetical protein